jgi:hypothetical protein
LFGESFHEPEELGGIIVEEDAFLVILAEVFDYGVEGVGG